MCRRIWLVGKFRRGKQSRILPWARRTILDPVEGQQGKFSSYLRKFPYTQPAPACISSQRGEGAAAAHEGWTLPCTILERHLEASLPAPTAGEEEEERKSVSSRAGLACPSARTAAENMAPSGWQDEDDEDDNDERLSSCSRQQVHQFQITAFPILKCPE